MILVLPTLILKWKRRTRLCANARSRTVSIISKRHIGRTSRHLRDLGNQTTEGNIANNELDSYSCRHVLRWSELEVEGLVKATGFYSSFLGQVCVRWRWSQVRNSPPQSHQDLGWNRERSGSGHESPENWPMTTSKQSKNERIFRHVLFFCD
jgi:hypothetical protein